MGLQRVGHDWATSVSFPLWIQKSRELAVLETELVTYSCCFNSDHHHYVDYWNRPPYTSWLLNVDRVIPLRTFLHGLIPGSERSLREGHGNPLLYSCLDNSMDRGTSWVNGVSKSQTWLKRLGTHAQWLSTQHKVLKTGLTVRKSVFINNFGDADSTKERASGYLQCTPPIWFGKPGQMTSPLWQKVKKN